MDVNKIYCEDCIETLKRMEDKSCDIVTDPPYNVGKDYGVYKDNLSDEEYLQQMELIIKEIKRVSVQAIIFIPHKYSRRLWWILGDDFRPVILETNMQGAIRYGFSNQYQLLLTNSKPNGIIRNVWRNINFSSCGYFIKENNFNHPGYTSTELLYRIVHDLTAHEIIYDPYMGVGSTAIAALKCNRQYIGSELNPEYVKIAEKRISAIKNQVVMFG